MIYMLKLLSELWQNWRLYEKFKNALIIEKYLIQTSKKKELKSLDNSITINNYLMIKEVNTNNFLSKFVDFHPSYFYKYKANYNIIVNELYSMFNDYLLGNTGIDLKGSSDLVINDYSKDVYIKEIIKDLALIEFDNKTLFIYINSSKSLDFHELSNYILYDNARYIIFKTELLDEFTIEDLITAFNLTYRNTNKLRLLRNLTNLFDDKLEKRIRQSEKNTINLFSKNNVDTITSFDFSKYIYFNEEFKLSVKDIVNVASLGTTGSGKTLTINLILLQVLLGGDYKRIIYFDTQDTFNKKIRNNINVLYSSQFTDIEDNYYFYVNEDNFYLNERDIVTAVNFIVESKGYVEEKDKSKLFQHIKYNNFEDFKQDLNNYIERIMNEKSVTKELRSIEHLKSVKEFINKVKIRGSSIFDDIESKNYYFCVLSFQNNIFYEISSYLYFSNLDNLLYDSKERKTYFFADELQKYLESDFIREMLKKLLREKRQYGFRFIFTGLEYQDVKEFIPFAQHIIYNSFNDVFLENQLKSKSKFENTNINVPKEKFIHNTVRNEFNKEVIDINLLDFKNI